MPTTLFRAFTKNKATRTVLLSIYRLPIQLKTAFLVNGLTDSSKNAAVTLLSEIAANLDCTVSQLAIAWASHNPHVSTVITGASTLEQLRHNLKAIEVTDQLSPDVMAQIDKRTLQLAD